MSWSGSPSIMMAFRREIIYFSDGKTLDDLTRISVNIAFEMAQNSMILYVHLRMRYEDFALKF